MAMPVSYSYRLGSTSLVKTQSAFGARRFENVTRTLRRNIEGVNPGPGAARGRISRAGRLDGESMRAGNQAAGLVDHLLSQSGRQVSV